MNKNLKKYAMALAKTVLFLKESEKESFVESYSKILAQKKLLLCYPQILSESLKIIQRDIQKNTVNVHYKSFVPEMSSRLKKIFGNNMIIQESVDQNLISGLVINLYNKKIDGSMSGRLQMIKSNMNS